MHGDDWLTSDRWDGYFSRLNTWRTVSTTQPNKYRPNTAVLHRCSTTTDDLWTSSPVCILPLLREVREVGSILCDSASPSQSDSTMANTLPELLLHCNAQVESGEHWTSPSRATCPQERLRFREIDRGLLFCRRFVGILGPSQ